MARIRTIKPTFWGSPEVAGMTRDARLLVLDRTSGPRVDRTGGP